MGRGTKTDAVLTVRPALAIGPALTALVCLAAHASAADWPQWGGADLGRNMVSGEKNLPDSFVPGEKNPKGGGIRMDTTRNVRWAARLGSYIYGNPTVAGGKVFVGTDDTLLEGDPRLTRTNSGMLQCIDASKTGDITETGRVWSYGGLERSLSSVAIAGGLLYAADLSGKVHCLDVATGKPVWVYETNAETWGTPLVADGKVYLGTQKGLFVLAAGKEARLLSRISLGAPAYNTPIAANGTIFVASERYLWAVQQMEPKPSAAAGGD